MWYGWVQNHRISPEEWRPASGWRSSAASATEVVKLGFQGTHIRVSASFEELPGAPRDLGLSPGGFARGKCGGSAGELGGESVEVCRGCVTSHWYRRPRSVVLEDPLVTYCGPGTWCNYIDVFEKNDDSV